MLPEKDVCDHLCNLFSVAVYPLMPILHQPDFLAQYRAFWAESINRNWHVTGPGQVVRKDPSFVCLLFSMLFAATIIESSGPDSGEAEDIFSGDLYFATMASLNLTGFPRRATHNSLAAYLFAQLQISREEEFLDSPTFVSTSFRTALSMGLHRDGSAFGCSPVQIETRRKLWWHAIHLDTMVASSSGLPPLFINENISNTGMVSIIEDRAVGATDLTEHEYKIDVRHLVARSRYTLTKSIRGIICKHLECKLDTLRDVEEELSNLDELQKSVWSMISQITDDKGTSMALTLNSQQYGSTQYQDLPLMEQEWTLENQAPTVQIFRLFSATMQHMMLHKAYIMLLYPAMKAQDKSIWGSVRQTAIRHSHAYIRLFALLCTTPQFAYFSWMYPGTYQPLQPLSLILADLIEEPKSDEAETSIGLVDAMFALYQVGEGVTSSGSQPTPNPSSSATTASSRLRSGTQTRRRFLSRAGQEVWSFLVSARRKALLQLGQDPHVLLPVSVDWSSYAAQPTCVCGGSTAPCALTKTVLSLPPPSQSRQPSSDQQNHFDAHNIFPSSSAAASSTRLQLQGQSLDFSSAPFSNLLNNSSNNANTYVSANTIIPQGLFPDLSSLSPWGSSDDIGSAGLGGPSSMASPSSGGGGGASGTEGMAFDWDQWDAVLGGAIGSLV
ncbi:hypothetical protein AAFC00_006597 [Neodothiora populina]|uniref:Xylanolytic transcriptional activator regulatory domain-containing protein n=1 Tax=Neodothiora populina TaxID=2781224 RepID=A0ABR3PAR6_9PEZI